MKNCQNICLYARQLGHICTTIDETAMGGQIDMDGVTLDPVASDLLLNQLEQAQMLVLALTDKITDALAVSDGEKTNTDEAGSAFAAGELEGKSKVTVENPASGEKKEG